MLLTATYLTLNGISGIAKISEIFLPIIVGSLLLVIGLSMNNFDFVNFRPVLMPSISSAIKCIPDLVIGFQGYEILFIMIPFMHDYRKVIPYTVVGVAIPVILYTLLVGMSIGVFGVHITQQLNYPTITLAETITFPGAFMERFDILFVILWIIAAFTTIANLYYMASLTSIRLLGLRHYKVSIYLLSPVIYIAAILPQNTLEIRKVTMLAGYIGIAISFITIGLLFLSWISGKREKENV